MGTSLPSILAVTNNGKERWKIYISRKVAKGGVIDIKKYELKEHHLCDGITSVMAYFSVSVSALRQDMFSYIAKISNITPGVNANQN